MADDLNELSKIKYQ